ncbi:PEP7 [Candida margitis]|uniref:PEP7 n=1 Tax=Candida margitis TaxID=1775924 RepID=UPI002226E40F|nr:PEP7 [Candida margitis]KAI5970494.1 PEP7 [Candida margitis]
MSRGPNANSIQGDGGKSPVKNTPITPTKKINKISVSDKGFSIGDITKRDTSPGSPSKNGITRSHWKQSQSQSQPTCKICGKRLNVKNGIVNCRKCGELFCNGHTHYRVKLRNPAEGEKNPQYDSSKDGVWCRCCETCFEQSRLTEVNFRDRTKEFKIKRQEQLDLNKLHRTKVQRNFIKLANLMVEKKSANKKSIYSFFQNVDDDERSITGGNWAMDNNVTNCTICFTKFNFLIRKHHCRLCGEIVCDDSNGVRRNCSMYVPLSVFVEKLPNLNYSNNFRDEFDLRDDELRFRCCVNCKNSLLYDWKREYDSNDLQYEEIFSLYEGMLVSKQYIERMMPIYEMGTSTVEEAKTGHKLTMSLKDLENLILHFKKKFFYKHNETLLVCEEYLKYNRILSNIYQSMGTFLHDNLVEFKAISEKNKPEEVSRPPKEESSPVPRLTKKQIRELREQLMVLNEQKFLVENQIQEFTKDRKFDELDSLITNKEEISQTISQLEEELGEFGF